MSAYQVDWIGAIGAGISAVVAFLIATRLVKVTRGATFYILFAVITFALSLGLRLALRSIGI